MTKFRVFGYKPGSRSAKTLAETLGGKVIKHVGSKYNPRAADIIINWGSSAGDLTGQFAPATVLNVEADNAQCKLKAFNIMLEAGVTVPTFGTDKNDIPDADFPVVCRTKLKGHSGEGVVIAETRDQLVDAPLYTKYIKKQDEYRVHVFHDNAFFIQRKARRLDVENPDWRVRNLAGGFVFVEQTEQIPPDVIEQAIKAVEALDLDFGGVDIIWNNREGKAYVLEVNTACGLEERTAGFYADQIRNYAQNRG